MSALSGRCQCGAVRYRATGEPVWVAHCHCSDCRRATGAAFVTWVGYKLGQLSFGEAQPQTYESSPGVQRGFCAACGTPLTYHGARWPDEIHIVAGTLDTPAAIKPQAHVYTIEQLPWVHLDDGLPRYRRTSSLDKAESHGTA